ncbi:MAG: hypothetical protein RID59_14455, partial [Hoeflea sp.]
DVDQGLVLTSIITSSSLPSPTFMAMGSLLLRRAGDGLGDEGDLLDAVALTGDSHPADELEARIPVAPDMDFRLRLQHRHFLDPVQKFAIVRHLLFVPEDGAFAVDRRTMFSGRAWGTTSTSP